MTVFWAEALADVGRTHLISANPADFPDGASEIPDLLGRSMLVRRAEMLPIECIVRGYLTGSAWKEYRETQTMHGAVFARRGYLESARTSRARVHALDQSDRRSRREHLVRAVGRARR